MRHTKSTKSRTGGFSLIELLIVIGISSIALGASYAVYSAQQRGYQQQEQLIELQQNIRAFLFFIEKDMRMAGYDPLKSGTPNFLVARPAEVAFSADLGRPRTGPDCKDIICDSMPDGFVITAPCADCVAETIRYGLGNDPDGDGIAGTGDNPPKITTSVAKVFNGMVSSSTNPAQDVITGVEALEFLYNLSDGTALTTVTGANLSNIRSVTISMLIRTHNPILGKINKDVYYFPASNAGHDPEGKKWGPFSDSYRRRLVITNIQCRNMTLRED